jgi:hypothetical protein
MELRPVRWIWFSLSQANFAVGHALGVIGLPKPNGLPAQLLATGKNLDPDPLVCVQPNTDSRLALCHRADQHDAHRCRL